MIVNGKIKNGRLTPNPIKTIQIENNNGKIPALIPDRAIRNRMSKSIPARYDLSVWKSDIKEELESENFGEINLSFTQLGEWKLEFGASTW